MAQPVWNCFLCEVYHRFWAEYLVCNSLPSRVRQHLQLAQLYSSLISPSPQTREGLVGRLHPHTPGRLASQPPSSEIQPSFTLRPGKPSHSPFPKHSPRISFHRRRLQQVSDLVLLALQIRNAAFRHYSRLEKRVGAGEGGGGGSSCARAAAGTLGSLQRSLPLGSFHCVRLASAHGRAPHPLSATCTASSVLASARFRASSQSGETGLPIPGCLVTGGGVPCDVRIVTQDVRDRGGHQGSQSIAALLSSNQPCG